MQQIQKVYLSPKLWYLRFSIIEAKDIMPGHRGLEVVRFPEFSTKVQLGNQIWRTGNATPSTTRSFSNPYWNMEHLFVVTEPFEDDLLVSVEDHIGPGKEEVVATILLPLATIEKQTEERPVTSRWFNLESHFGSAIDNHKLNSRFVSQIHMQISFEEDYDVLDEGTIHSNDVKTTDKRLWKPQVGVLEMRILGAIGLAPMKKKDGRGVIDAYCVAKYGKEWVKTHTIVGSLAPKWNQQYTWEVYDPCSVLTIGVFDDGGINKNTTTGLIACDCPIGKVRIRLSTIGTDRLFMYSYPLLKLNITGVRKMGELQLALRYSCRNVANMLRKYTMPLLPKMHYLQPLSAYQLDSLRYEAVNVEASKLSNEEPPLSNEVVRYINNREDFQMWSLRRSKANYYRLARTVWDLISPLKWLVEIPNWKNPVFSALFLMIYSTLVMFPTLIIPSILLYMAFVALWNYRFRPRYPPHMDVRLSQTDNVDPDELAEEFDTFPTTASDDLVRMRYDRLRVIAGRLQTIAGDVASLGECIQALVSWRDPRATFLFMMICLVSAVAFYVVPIRVVVALLGFYLLRPPCLRSKCPPQVVCFFKRLPSKADNILVAGEEKDYVCQDTQGFLVVRLLENSQLHFS